jgi:OmpA-OmpF porin, OOP family
MRRRAAPACIANGVDLGYPVRYRLSHPHQLPLFPHRQRYPMAPPQQLSRLLALLLALLFIAATGAAAQTRDVAGSRDLAGIGRFGGSVITGYQVKDFDAARMQAAAFKDGKPADARRLEGRITRIAYRTKPGPSILEVSGNFETQLTKAGFETLVACDTDACGGIPFTEAIDSLPVPQMWVDGFNYHYYSGHKTSGGRETYASVLVSENNSEITAQLTVAELGAIENKMVDAAAMAKGLGESGHIALYGIYFDTDKATLKPESRPTLEQIAKLMASQPQLNVFIVGHTDSQGAFDYNLDLSQRRAEAVAAELVRSYHIAQPRLHSAGVGMLAPVGSNATESGRALNRRVELVAP